MDSSCILYCSSELDIKEFQSEIATFLNLQRETFSFFHGDFFELSISKNDEFNSKLQHDFPDGFLYFKYLLSFAFNDTLVTNTQIELINKILGWMWNKNIPTIAACDYEDKLLNNGGYRNTSLPWPEK